MNPIPYKKLPDPDPRDPFAVRSDPFAESVAHAAQEVSVRGWPGHTLRDEANALTIYIFRNTFVEDLHAGGRITDHEMKKYNIQASAKLAHILHLRDWLRRAFPIRWYTVLEGRFLPFQKAKPWERVALDWEIPADDYVQCACGRQLPRGMWNFCPWCGRAKAGSESLVHRM